MRDVERPWSGSGKKQCQLKRLLLDEQIDICAVQETKLSIDEQIAKALEPFLSTYQVCVSHAVGCSAGCFLFLKKTLPLTGLSIVTVNDGRFVLCDFALFGKEWRIFCVYAPNVATEREGFFVALSSFLETDKTVVWLGDFYCVCDKNDRCGPNVYVDNSVRVLEGVIDDFDLVDVGKVKPAVGGLTYTRFQGASHARLDRIYISASVSNEIGKYFVKPVCFSDHFRFLNWESRAVERQALTGACGSSMPNC